MSYRHYVVPVIATHIATGEVTQYPSIVEASKALDVAQCMISRGIMNEHIYCGYRFERLEDKKVANSRS